MSVFTCADFSKSGVDVCVCESLTKKPVEPAQLHSILSGDSSLIAPDSKAWSNNDFPEPALPRGFNGNGSMQSPAPIIHFLHLQKRPVEDSDWRKNVEAMSGMEGRKKMFDAAKGSAQ